MSSLLVLIVLLVSVGLAFLVLKWPGGMHLTFSQHAAKTKWSQLYYCLLFVITLPLLTYFLVRLASSKHLPAIFLDAALVAVIFQFLCTLVPEVGGVKTIVHRVLTGISAAAMLPLVAILAVASSLSTIAHAIAWCALILMAIILVVGLLHQRGFRYALLLQSSYYVVFFAVLFAAAI